MLEYVHQGLAPMRLRVQARSCKNAAHFAPEHGNGGRALAIGGRSEETQETVLADHPPPVVENLDPDVVQIARPVDCGTGIGFCYREPLFRSGDA